MNPLHFQKDISHFKGQCSACKRFTAELDQIGQLCGTAERPCAGIFKAITVYQVALTADDIAEMKRDGCYKEVPHTEQQIANLVSDGIVKQEVLDAIGSEPDPDRQAKGECPICKRQCFDESQVGQRCDHVDKKTGKRCVGLYNGRIARPAPDRINLDGDKVIMLCKAMEQLAKDFEALNITEIKEAFLMGRKVLAVEEFIRVSKLWNEAFDVMRKRAGEAVLDYESHRARSKEVLGIFEQLAARVQAQKQCNHVLLDFVALCDRLEAHRKSGLLDAVSQLLNNSKTQ